LEIFVHEPIFVNTDNGTHGEECVERTVEDQVNLLIGIAADPLLRVVPVLVKSVNDLREQIAHFVAVSG
jgi:hypothetical protein